MLELIRKSLLLGFGAALVTREKVREKIQSLVDQGKITSEEAEKLTTELVETGEKEMENLREEIAQAVRNTLDNMDVARRSSLEKLHDEMDGLKNRLDFLEDRVKSREN